MQTRAILKSITQLAGNEAQASVQLTGIGNLQAFYDNLQVNHGINHALLVPGADILVDIPDPNHPTDGQVLSVAHVSSGGTTSSTKEQFGYLAVSTDGSGNGAAAVTFPNTFSSFSSTPTVSVSAQSDELANGSISTSSITTSGFNITISTATPSSSVSVSWDATGT